LPFGGAGFFLFILAALHVPALHVPALHVVKPQLDPSWRLISEYAIGWLMLLAFDSLSASCVALHFCAGAFARRRRAFGGGAGALGSALFVADPPQHRNVRQPATGSRPPRPIDQSFTTRRNTDSARRRVLAGKIVVQEPAVNVWFYPSIYRQDGCRSRCGQTCRFQASAPSAAS